MMVPLLVRSLALSPETCVTWSASEVADSKRYRRTSVSPRPLRFNDLIPITSTTLRLMTHRVGDVVDDDPKSESGKFLRVFPGIRPFPCVTQMHVEADRYFDAPVAVANRPPPGNIAVLFIGAARCDVLLAGNLKFFIDTIHDVVDRVVVREIFHLGIG